MTTLFDSTVKLNGSLPLESLSMPWVWAISATALTLTTNIERKTFARVPREARHKHGMAFPAGKSPEKMWQVSADRPPTDCRPTADRPFWDNKSL